MALPLAREDEVEASRAPLIAHLVELRRRLIWVVLGVLAAFLVCIFFAKDIYNLLVLPYRWANGFDRPVEMIYTAPQEFFFTQLKLAFFGAVFLAFPIIATQIYMFVAPGLYRNERSAFVPYLIATPLLFIFGASVVYFGMMPLAMKFFLSMQQTEGPVKIELAARVSEYLSLIMSLMLAFGAAFQLPVVLTLLAQAGIVTSQFLVEKRRYAVVAVFAVAAVITPPDALSQIGLAIPTLGLYEISILIIRRIEKRRAAAEAKRDAELGL